MPKPLLEANNISKSYGKQLVLDNLSFQIAEGQKIALIGRNGAGKSTLLKILLDEIKADDGQVKILDWTRVGVIYQNEVLPSHITSLSYLEKVSGKPSWEVKKLGAKFGLHDLHLHQPPAELSGGYQMRVKLVGMFLQEPNLLFLDEPVNYLDLQTLLLLENILADYRGSYVLVAHDRTFLQNTCDVVYEIERGKLTTYNGKIQEFLEWKREQIEFARRTNKRLSREIQHNQEFVDRFRAKANLATRAQNKIKHIAKLRTKIMKIDADLARTRISIKSPHVHPGTAVDVDDLVIGYGDYIVARDISFDIARGEKVVIAGENGRGKSTLLKTLMGKIDSLDGVVKWWKRADVGYYDQLTNKSLDDKDTVLDHLTKSAPGQVPAEQILMMAGNFLFRGDDLDKKVAILSGGERARLALAGVLLKVHNVLVLDEPTNHMDVETTEGLALALKDYKGTVIFVSHARTFVNALADRILEVRHGSVREYMGSYDEYVEDLAALMEQDSQSETAEISPEKQQRIDDHNKRRERHQLIKEIKRSLNRLETQMDKLEPEKSEILKFFFENPTDYSPPRAQRLDEINQELANLEGQWMKAQEKIEELRLR